MASYSKLLPYTCYELGHTWNHSCSQASMDMFVTSAIQSLKVYAVVYLATALVSRKKLSKEYAIKLLKNYIQSVIFLSINGCTYVGSFCVLKILLGHINYLTASFVPGFISSLLAIAAERPSRRSLLAIYVSNIASECLWNVGKTQGYVKPFPRGEVFLFVASMAIFGYYFKSSTNFSPLINTILKLMLGKKESGDYVQLFKSTNARLKSEDAIIKFSNNENNFLSFLHSKHVLCPHKDGCLASSAKAFIKGFAGGFLFQVGLKALSSVTRLVRRPGAFIDILLLPSTLQFALFISFFNFSFKVVCCIGRQVSAEDKPIHGAIAGGLAGLSMLFYSSPSLAMYVLWKAIEAMYEKGQKAGYLPLIPGGIEMLYALSTAYLFHVAVMAKEEMKPSYWRFLQALTRGRMGEYNRIILEKPYGINSGKNQLWPKYSLDNLSPKFKEKFADWF